MKFWSAVLVIGLVTYFYRYSFMGGRIKIPMPDLAKRGLAYVPTAVLAALVGLGFFVDAEKLPSLSIAALAAFLVAGGLAIRFKQDLVTIGAGLAACWLVAWING